MNFKDKCLGRHFLKHLGVTLSHPYFLIKVNVKPTCSLAYSLKCFRSSPTVNFVMPRKYIRSPGSRPYKNYDEVTLKKAVEDVVSGRLSQRKASATYKIPITTLKNKLKNIHNKKPGGQRIFNDKEEQSFVDHLIKLSEFGFPVDDSDFRSIVRSYLQRRGITVNKFRDNTPGRDWITRFLRDHTELSVRFTQNIKRVRAGVSELTISAYFEHLRKELVGIPPSNIFNYDETNLSDNPGNKRAIVKRGAKYLDRICNHSKTSTSIMFCGNAEGKLLPPYVVYKADHLWSCWVENGPTGARYNRTKSGWFDVAAFEDWFLSLFLPAVRNLQGDIALIGDNLSSHISSEVLEKCQKHRIKFICLPPNATHLLQPLDVSFYGPLKRAWRKVLSTWRDSARGSQFPTIPKDQMPGLLKKLVDAIEPNKQQNLISGFRKCGIFPIDKDVVLARLPSKDADSELIGEAFMDSLIARRNEVVGSDHPRQRRKKINVPAGKSITIRDIVQLPQPRPLKMKTNKCSQRLNSSTDYEESSSDDGNDLDMVLDDSDTDQETFSESDDQSETVDDPESWKHSCKVEDFVIVKYNEAQYPGKIVRITEDGPTVDCMELGKHYWHWPEKHDILQYEWKNVVKKIEPPQQVSSKRKTLFVVPELSDFTY